MNANLASVVGGFYQANLGVGEWSDALTSLRETFGADVCTVISHDFRGGKSRITHAVGIDPAAVTAFAGDPGAGTAWFRDPRQFHTPGSVIRGCDLIGAGELMASAFFERWLKPLKLLDHLFVVLDRQGDRAVFLAIGRSEEAGRFDDDAVSLLSRLAADLHRAIQAGKALLSSERFNRIALSSLNAMPIGVAFLNADGGVVAANRLAQGVINSGEGLYVANGGLAVELSGRRLKIRDLVAQLGAAGRAEGQRQQPLMVVRHSGKRPLTLFFSAVDERDDFATDIEAILFIGDPERPATFDHGRITKLYGLSKAEARVAALLASGYRLEQAAEILGVAYETVRKHLKQIFSKTGTYRQAELVRMIVTGPAGLMI